MTFSEITLLFFFGLSTISLYWLLGRMVLLIFSWRSERPVPATALSIVVGFTLTTVLYSLLKARPLNTVSAVIVVITIVWLMLRKKAEVEKLHVPLRADFVKITREWPGFALMVFFFLLIFVVQLIKLDSFDNKSVPVGFPDYPFYITVSEQLNAQGVENMLSYLNQIQGISITSSQPYHFFDLWFNAFLQWGVPTNHAFVYLFVCIPELVFFGFLMLVYVGYFCVDVFRNDTSNRAENWSWIPFIAFLFLFLVGYFPYSKIGQDGFEFLEAPLFNNPKFYYSYFLLGIGIPLYWRRWYITLVFVLLVSCYFFIVYIPLAATILLILLLEELRKYGLKNMHPEVKYAGIMFVTGILLLGIFYYLQPTEKQLGEVVRVNSSEVIRVAMRNFFSLGSLLKFLRAYAVKVIYFVPFLIIVLGMIWKKEGRESVRKLIMLPLLLIVSGAFWSFAFNFHIEGFQFLAQAFSAGLYFIFFISILWSISKSKNRLRIAAWVLISVQVVLSVVITTELNAKNQYVTSTKFKNDIVNNSIKFSGLGLYVVNLEGISSSSRNVSPYLNYYTGFMKFLPDTWLLQASNIKPDELSKASKEFRQVYLQSPFVQFMNLKKMPFAESVKEFAKENKILFLVWKKGNIDETAFAEVIDHTLCDSQSGYCISFLSNR